DPVRRQAIKDEVAANHELVKAAGGLLVIGTERHESRRIDNQLRGRSGRQGDPGASSFFLSLEDDLMRIFGTNRMEGVLQRLGLQEGEAIVHRWINKALERAQQKVEARNFEIRKNLLRYDDVMNAQRKVVYAERIEMMAEDDLSDTVSGMRQQVIEGMVKRAIPEGSYSEQWDVAGLKEHAQRVFGLELPVDAWAKEEGIADDEIRERLLDATNRQMAEKAANYGPEVMRQVEKSVVLQVFDQSWKEHLLHLDQLRQGIGLRAYGQKDPLNEYKREAFNLFDDMLANMREEVTRVLAYVQIRFEEPPQMPVGPDPSMMQAMHESPAMAGADALYADASSGMLPPGGLDPDPVTDNMAGRAQPVRNARASTRVDPNDPGTWGKVSRNAVCPCGSGKKYKHCHGRFA
ncbi:MAG: SEC-C domain-containing protein, partial [Alphaproteobacteria bacterium]|nr:SEC-C domain-containing protein [Alphaproteobacteria bacterium]